VFSAQGPVTADRLTQYNGAGAVKPVQDDQTVSLPAGLQLRDAMQTYIEFTLKQMANNRRRAATSLGISLQTLNNRLAAPPEDAKTLTAGEA
jgi:DNA-binding NtrC family response regulator